MHLGGVIYNPVVSLIRYQFKIMMSVFNHPLKIGLFTLMQEQLFYFEMSDILKKTDR